MPRPPAGWRKGSSAGRGGRPLSDVCVACEGSGVSTSGSRCVPCGGSGRPGGSKASPRVWICPACGIEHQGFSRDVCRNRECERYAQDNEP